MKAIATLAILSLTAVVLHAQTNAPATKPAAASPPPAPPSAFEKFTRDMKKPAPYLTWGADLRIRNEYLNNAITLTDAAVRHEQDVIRIRGRLWATATPVDGLSLNMRFSGEPREWMKPSFSSNYRNQQGQVGKTGLEERYGIFDLLNAKWTNSWVSITGGRQDIMFGDFYDWWLVLDGTPGDGSWTFFLDSVRMSIDVSEMKTKFDIVALYQNARPDEWLPTLGTSGPNPPSNPAGYGLTEQNEAGAIFYASNKSLKNTQIDGYFIYKGDYKEFANGDNADIYTVGAKVTGTPSKHWQYSVEGAYQLGSKEDRIGTIAERDISAYGGKLKATYLLKDKLNNQVSLIGEFLSGDDPDTTGKDEMFDILWGRWPRWSELYIYSYVMETSGKIAQLNNIGRIGPSWSMAPVKGMSLSVMYNALFAPQDTPTRAMNRALFSRDGNFRGHYLQTVLKHTFNKHLNAHLWAEFVWEGDYYAQRDMMSFLRGEVYLTW
jgi:hypothetical protein